MTPTMARPGGRSAKVTAAVHRAVVELLAEGDPLTIPQVAARAGVNATSVYRRWGDVGALLADTALVRFGTSGDVPDTGSLRGDLHAWGTALVAEAARPEELALLRAAVAAGPADPGAPAGFESACSACLVGRSTQAEAIVAAAARRGEEAPTTTRVLDHLVAPVYFRALFGLPAPSVDVLVELLVERLVAPATAQAAPSALG
ncbi:TetR/AcrR family transcriptional regulator C-terminal ligand-binding domain-containing protein [Kineococcus aurantiacus]|uniref:AcrR family transcriptional regulator n=1 Tax=Kineococcus aurantiacus TaxID=37633 RepID=A0A7Y9DLR9_9ACTN|nr:TetR/AcrR family transcriptional regulator C-terminal ligand-binding domain-containing protein [Kineococcus aurantiacus]NYD22844.1 AcrR family transcriptional regulator [Kineococcus aurantiacus]